MKKYIKKHLKDEKRLLKLMYKKGIFDLLKIDFDNLSWEYLLDGKRQRKRKGKWAYKDFLPELHEWTQDYWGEGDSNGVVESFKQYYWFEFATERDDDGYPRNCKIPTNKTLIEYLLKLPTKHNDSKFNKFLVCNAE